MALDRARATHYLKNFEFARLFTQLLGWEHFGGTLAVKAGGGDAWTLQGVSEKRGAVVMVADGIPDYVTRLKIEKQVAKTHFEHVLIFADSKAGRQVWQWVRRESGRP